MAKKMYDYVFVGAGLFNAVLASRAVKEGKKCLVIDSRSHIGGNCYTWKHDSGIIVHQYGAHIFHTSSRNVWDFVNRYAVFNRFTNSPIALYRLRETDSYEQYNLPFNMNTFRQLFNVSKPCDAYREIAIDVPRELVNAKPKNLEEQALQLAGKTIYEKLIKHYTEKQWGRSCTELDPSIIKRVPLRFRYDNNYFTDRYQGIPIGGYTKMIDNMFGGCEIQLGIDYLDEFEKLNGMCDHVFYSGCVARMFNYGDGYLNYRSLAFDTNYYNRNDTDRISYGNAVVNFTGPVEPYTRMIDHKYFDPSTEELDDSVITYEYPQEWKVGREMYYPVNDDRNMALYRFYADRVPHNITLTGRLGLYKYLDMDDTVELALEMPMSSRVEPWYKRLFHM